MLSNNDVNADDEMDCVHPKMLCYDEIKEMMKNKHQRIVKACESIIAKNDKLR